MNYYKVINNDRQIIDVLIDNNITYVKWQNVNKLLISCDEQEAEGFLSSDCMSVYHTENFSKLPSDVDFIEVILKEITEDDYNLLRKALDESKPIEPEPEPEPTPEPEEPKPDDDTLQLVKSGKVSEMSKVCNNTITNGFDVVLSDGKSHHFSLTTQDQLNLITLTGLVSSGETSIAYHADNELCKFYSAEDIACITNYATQFKTYHVSYFNSLKAYIEALEDVKEISSIEYGTDIPEEYQSEVLKALLQQR
jgi:hypothetical protein